MRLDDGGGAPAPAAPAAPAKPRRIFVYFFDFFDFLATTIAIWLLYVYRIVQLFIWP
jgi:hypothetical protein